MVIYCDGADLGTMEQLAKNPIIEGWTTNPTLMKRAGIKRYKDFAQQVLNITDKPVSFEVLSDDWDDMERQAEQICSWGENVYAKIPITNTKDESSINLIDKLSDLNLNITAVFTNEQLDALQTVDRAHHIISVFSGRIMDAGDIPPRVYKYRFSAKILWASTRETKNIDLAEHYGYDIITLTPDLIAKLPLRGKDLAEYSLETVRQFHEDGKGIEF